LAFQPLSNPRNLFAPPVPAAGRPVFYWVVWCLRRRFPQPAAPCFPGLFGVCAAGPRSRPPRLPVFSLGCLVFAPPVPAAGRPVFSLGCFVCVRPAPPLCLFPKAATVDTAGRAPPAFVAGARRRRASLQPPSPCGRKWRSVACCNFIAPWRRAVRSACARVGVGGCARLLARLPRFPGAVRTAARLARSRATCPCAALVAFQPLSYPRNV
jgi:hypothetical protein